ncbi:radical SAM protein [Vulcanisaeta sp. SCGC AB-777_J10]|nr:radical SAM protein [Vulcanisaeta sp. SCGC AB-777_J10]
MQTRISHITYYVDLKSLYIQFLGCNLHCPWCIRKLTPWDHHLDKETLVGIKFQGLLTIEEFKEIINRVKELEDAVLGGEEPTIDPSLPLIIRILREHNVNIRLLTNAYEISTELLNELVMCASCEVVVSLKSLNPEVYRRYVGGDLNNVLLNIEKMINRGVKVIFETVLISGLNGLTEVEEIAQYISTITNNPYLIIDPLIPIQGIPWRRPTDEEVREAVRRAGKYVNVLMHERSRRSRVIVLYPKVSHT